MFRSYLIAAGAALLCSTAVAQQKLDPSRLYPVTAPIKNAGTVDVSTGKWTKPAQQVKTGSQSIYNNTCTWTTLNYYAGFDWCEENYDEGRIPSPSSPGSHVGAQVNNTVISVQIAYCTFVADTIVQAGGGYDMELAFWNKLNGDCVGLIPPTPPPPSSTATAYFDLSGLGLPGSTTTGFQACWIVTLDTTNSGFVLASDGEGTFNGTPADDKFIWMQAQNQTQATQLPNTPDGFLIVGEPATGGYGACSYTIPCGTDALFGNTCGTGLDTFDASWINVDGIAVGGAGQPANCVNTVAQYGFGTNCYFFGGYPTNPLASYWLIMESDGRPTNPISFYCAQTKATSVPSCVPQISATNTTLATGVWHVSNVPLGPGVTVTVGIFIYTDGVGIGQSTFSSNIPFGRLCLQNFKRSSPACPASVNSGSPNTCVGQFNVAVNCNSGALGVAVGEDVNVQCWYRDPPNVANANFTNAIFYTVN
jgi:hypothetical protein